MRDDDDDDDDDDCNTECVMMMMTMMMMRMMARLVYLVNSKIIHVIVSEGPRFEWLKNVRVLSEIHATPFL